MQRNMKNCNTQVTSSLASILPPPPTKPQRPLSAYNLFFRLERTRILKQLEDSCTDEIEKEAIRKAQDVTDKKRATISAEDVAGISNEKRNGLTKRQERKKHGKIGFSELVRVIAKRWNELPQEEKKLLEERAREEKEKYDVEMKKHNKRLKEYRKKYSFGPKLLSPQIAANADDCSELSLSELPQLSCSKESDPRALHDHQLQQQHQDQKMLMQLRQRQRMRYRQIYLIRQQQANAAMDQLRMHKEGYMIGDLDTEKGYEGMYENNYVTRDEEAEERYECMYEDNQMGRHLYSEEEEYGGMSHKSTTTMPTMMALHPHFSGDTTFMPQAHPVADMTNNEMTSMMYMGLRQQPTFGPDVYMDDDDVNSFFYPTSQTSMSLRETRLNGGVRLSATAAGANGSGLMVDTHLQTGFGHDIPGRLDNSNVPTPYEYRENHCFGNYNDSGVAVHPMQSGLHGAYPQIDEPQRS